MAKQSFGILRKPIEDALEEREVKLANWISQRKKSDLRCLPIAMDLFEACKSV